MNRMDLYSRETQAFQKLTDKADRYHPSWPKMPDEPRTPAKSFAKFETIKTTFDTSMSVADLVEAALEKAGLDMERLPADIREALDHTSVEAERDRDDSISLKVEWKTLTENPKYAEERAVFLTEMIAYERAVAEYITKLDAWVQERNQIRAHIAEQKDRADYERLKGKFEGKGM